MRSVDHVVLQNGRVTVGQTERCLGNSGDDQLAVVRRRRFDHLVSVQSNADEHQRQHQVRHRRRTSALDDTCRRSCYSLHRGLQKGEFYPMQLHD